MDHAMCHVCVDLLDGLGLFGSTKWNPEMEIRKYNFQLDVLSQYVQKGNQSAVV